LKFRYAADSNFIQHADQAPIVLVEVDAMSLTEARLFADQGGICLT
jgi:hypothetical protein